MPKVAALISSLTKSFGLSELKAILLLAKNIFVLIYGGIIAYALSFNDDKLSFVNVSVNAYFASVAADFIRHKLIERSESFTFETVSSWK